MIIKAATGTTIHLAGYERKRNIIKTNHHYKK